MRSPLHWALRPTRTLLAALSLLALLLLVPSGASACGGTSSEVIYCSGAPGIESGESIQHNETSTKHKHPKPNTGEEPTETTTEPETEPSGGGHKSLVAPPAKGGNHPGGGKPQGHAAPKDSGDHISQAKIVTPKSSEAPTTKGHEASASSGGSSPVLPILVAIVVLATISIGVVVYRERKGDDGPAGYTGARG